MLTILAKSKWFSWKYYTGGSVRNNFTEKSCSSKFLFFKKEAIVSFIPSIYIFFKIVIWKFEFKVVIIQLYIVPTTPWLWKHSFWLRLPDLKGGSLQEYPDLDYECYYIFGMTWKTAKSDKIGVKLLSKVERPEKVTKVFFSAALL